MSTAFDPETGERIAAPSAQADRAARSAIRNPYETAIAVIWISSAVLAFLLLLVDSSLAADPTSSFPDPQGTVAATMVAAVVFTVLAVLVGIAHLTVRAVAWRPPTV